MNPENHKERVCCRICSGFYGSIYGMVPCESPEKTEDSEHPEHQVPEHSVLSVREPLHHPSQKCFDTYYFEENLGDSSVCSDAEESPEKTEDSEHLVPEHSDLSVREPLYPLPKLYTGYFKSDDVIKWSEHPEGPKTVSVAVYYNGQDYTSPDPADEGRCERILGKYRNGMYIQRDLYEISKYAYSMLRYGMRFKPDGEGPNKIMDSKHESESYGYARAYDYSSIKKPTDYVYQRPKFIPAEFTKILIQKYGMTLNYITFQDVPEVIARGYDRMDWTDYARALLNDMISKC